MNAHPRMNPCPTCGTALPADIPGGFCPSCILVELEASFDSLASRPWPPSPDDARKILAGQPYEVLARIGHGGMGAVFKVRNLEPGLARFEAVKIRRPEMRDDDLFRERFLREIGTLAQLRHPGIPPVYRSGESIDGFLWFSMEFLEGHSLAALLAPGMVVLSPEQVLDITRQLCAVLQFIHKADRLHRDLKPSNVMVCNDGSVRLLDFGIARHGKSAPMVDLTRPGEYPHTPEYAAPEQKIGEPVDERADLYGLGGILAAMIRQPSGSARVRLTRLDQKLQDLANELLSNDRQNRPQSAADVFEKLERIETFSPGFWGKRRCPFRGFEAYQPEHSEIFFGRDAAIRRGTEILLADAESVWNGFLLITGASGSGKSSLASAGLGPALLQDANSRAAGDSMSAPIIFDLTAVRPEDDCLLPPLARLVASSSAQSEPVALAAALRDPATNLGDALGLLPDPTRSVGICIVIDQFEQFFRTDLPRSSQARFLLAISRLAGTSGIVVLITMRSDFYHQCASYPILMGLKDGRQLDVIPPQSWEYAAMLRLGARATALSFEAGADGRGLDDVLLEQVRLNPQALPLLSFVLERLWDLRDIPSNTLRFADYYALGGFEQAVGTKAKETLDRFAKDFEDDASPAFNDLLQLLVEASESDTGEAFVRRRATPTEMTAATRPVRDLSERLVTARLLVRDSSGLTFAHEALLSPAVADKWDALHCWLAQNSDDLRIRKRISVRCRDWVSHDRPAEVLLSFGTLLSDSARLLKERPAFFSAEQREFIQQSDSAEQTRRAARRRRWGFAVLGLLAITGGLSYFRIPQNQRLPTQQDPPQPVNEPASDTNQGGLSAVTKDKPFINSLGMKFVPIQISAGPSKGARVLFSVWETRVADFEAFVSNSPTYRYEERPAPFFLEVGKWIQNPDLSWKDPGYRQTGEHPVTCIDWDDAKAFCAWLTEKERASGKIPEGGAYRLPTDHEWSCAVGIGDFEDAAEAPEKKDGRLENSFPWGTAWPPPQRIGNYGSYGSNALDTDIFDRTSPVGSFPATATGLYDLGGNVWEWCEDLYKFGESARVARGASWVNFRRDSLGSSYRDADFGRRKFHTGYRCVLAIDSQGTAAAGDSPKG